MMTCKSMNDVLNVRSTLGLGAAVVMGVVAALSVCPGACLGGTWTYAPWTGDGDSGINGDFYYPVAINCNGPAVTVNGVDFQAWAASGPNFSLGGDIQPWGPGGSPNISGGSATLAQTFIYNGAPRIVTLNNLQSGRIYETTFFSYGWDAPGVRLQTFASGSDSIVVDQGLYGNPNGIRISYTFVATGSSQELTITPNTPGYTLHLAALANRDMSAICWDNNGSAAGFGTTASGTWAAPTLGSATQGWSTDYLGGLTPADTTTTLSDRLFFGFGANGLGTGTVTVEGTVAAGNLVFASSSGAVTLSDGTITLAGTAAIRVDNASATISSALAGAAAGLTKSGTGTLTLSGANSFSGGTTLSAGVLSLGHGSGLGAADTPLTFNGGSLDVNGYAITSSGVNMTGSSRLVSTGAAGSLAANSITVNNGSVAICNVGVDGRAGNLQVGPGSPASLTLDNATMGNAKLLLGLRYQNGGSLVLTNGARLAIIPVYDFWGQGSAIGNGNSDYSVTVTGTNSLLDYNYDYLRIGLTGSRNQLIVSDGGTVTNTQYLRIGDNGWYGRHNRLVVSGGGRFHLGGGDAAVGTGGEGDFGQNENSLIVEGTNALTGAASLVDLQGSPLTVGTLGTRDNTCNVRAGGVLRCGALTLNDPSSRLNLDGGVLAVTGINGVGTNYLGNGGVCFDNGAGGTTVANAIQDAPGCSGGLTKLGSGTLTLSAANTYTGPTSVSNGVMAVTGTQVLPTATDVFLWTATGAKLELAFEGTTTVRRLYIDNKLQVRNKLYSAVNRPLALAGAGFLAVTEGESGGMLMRLF